VTRVLALDVGTSSVRARVYDERGGALERAEAQTRYDVTHGRGGVAELDPEQLVAATLAARDEATREAAQVDAVACSCFWHSLLGLGRDGRPTTPLLIWQDTRSVGQAERLAEELDAEAVHRRTGCPLHPAYWPSKLRWLAEEHPAPFEATARFVSFGDYLFERMTGERWTTLSSASGTGLLELGTGTWDAELLEAVGLTLDRLPLISDEPAGVVYPPLGDGACSNVGAGCTTRDRAALMIGTSGALRTSYAATDPEPRPGLFLYRLDDRRLVEGGSLSDGGNLWAWLKRTLREVDATGLADEEPAAHGLTFLPLLGGERAPGWNARARGAITGLTFETTTRDIVQAALEGVAFRFAAILDLMPETREVVATGHALLANEQWLQILADVLGVPVTASAVAEGSARGAAVVTLERLGETPEPAPLGSTYAPRVTRTEAYRSARERQAALYRAAQHRGVT
jgi:gluconokinase